MKVKNELVNVKPSHQPWAPLCYQYLKVIFTYIPIAVLKIGGQNSLLAVFSQHI